MSEVSVTVRRINIRKRCPKTLGALCSAFIPHCLTLYTHAQTDAQIENIMPMGWARQRKSNVLLLF